MIKCNIYLTKHEFIKSNFIIIWKTFSIYTVICIALGIIISSVLASLYQNYAACYIIGGLVLLIVFFLVMAYFVLLAIYYGKYLPKLNKAVLTFNGSKLHVQTFKNGEEISDKVYDTINLYNVYKLGKNLVICLNYTDFFLIEKNDYATGNFEELYKLLKEKKAL